MATEIIKLNPSNEENYTGAKYGQSWYDLGITSKKSALLLNAVIGQKINDCPYKIRERYWSSSKNMDNISGGGFLIKGKAAITINQLNEVGIFFHDSWGVGKYIRTSNGKAEMAKAIKDKVANELKKAWNNGAKNEEYVIDLSTYGNCKGGFPLEIEPEYITKGIDGKEYVKISLHEYRALYEFLKGRNEEKVKERTGSKAFSIMVGKKIEDQFLLSAIDVIKNEIKNVEAEYLQAIKDSETEYNNELNAAKSKKYTAQNTAMEIKKAKISELENQMKEMLNGMIPNSTAA